MRDGQLLNVTQSLLYPMLEEHKNEMVEALCFKFQQGKTDFIADVAQLAYVYSLINELKYKQIQGNKAAEKIQEEAT